MTETLASTPTGDLSQKDEALTKFSLQCAFASFVLYFALLNLSKYFIQIPKSWNLAKPFDRLIVRHRITSCIHGVVAMSLTTNWWINH